MSCVLLGLRCFLVSSQGFDKTVELNHGKKSVNSMKVQRPPRLLC